MGNKISEIFFGRNVKLSGLLALSIVMLIGLGCLCNKKPGSIPAAYLGDWQGQDGTTISLRSDGGGDYKAGSSNVTNGTAEVNESDKTISIKFIGMGRTFKIDEPPTGDQMKLDGVVFRRRGGFDTSSSPSTNTSTSSSPSSSPMGKNPFPSDDPTGSPTDNSSQAGLPSNVEVETLVKATLADFSIAIEDEDFTDFLRNTSAGFQSSNSPTKTKQTFQVFIDKKDGALPALKQVDSTSVNFTTPPSVRTAGSSKVLTANGNFPTRPYVTNFEMEYKMENGKWKIQAIRVKM